jgi:CHAT domain-containing protein/Flp pilus assembly protein TadD
MGQGIAFNGVEQYNESVKCFKEATKLNPKSYQAWSSHGYALIYADENQYAIASFCAALKLFPKYPRAWRGKGLALAHSGSYREALNAFNKALELKSNYYQAWSSQSITLANLGHKDEAIVCSDKALELRPNYSKTYYLRGLMLSILGENDEAVASYNRAIELQPNYPEAYYKKGIAQTHSEDRREEAIESFREAIKLQENYPHAYYHLAVTYQRLRRSQKAIPNYEKVIELQPDYPKAWESYLDCLCILAKLSGHERDVASSCDQAIKLKPDHHEIYRIKADALMRLDRYNYAHEALRLYENAIGYGDDSSEVWFGKGNAEKQLKHLIEAASSYRKAVERRSDSWEAWDNWGWVILANQRRGGGFREALRIWNLGLESLRDQRSESSKEGCAKLYYSIGVAQYKEGLYRESKENYIKAAKLYRTIKDFSNKLHLREKCVRISRDMISVCQDLKEHLTHPEKYQQQLDIAEISLESLISDTSLPSKKLELKRRFESFYQLRVDQYVQSGDLVQAFELAEKRKNICLSWFYKNWEQSLSSLLGSFKVAPGTAIIYWHISPAAITTFILTSSGAVQAITNEQVLGVKQILSDNRPKIKYNRLKNFEDWMSIWKRDYQIDRSSKGKGTKKRSTQSSLKKPDDYPWRSSMDVRLLQLSQILNISEIIELYLTNVNQLILVPHRDLHLLPLHALFSFPYSCSKQNLLAILYLLIACKIPLLFKGYKTEKSSELSNFLTSPRRFTTSYLPSLQAATYLKQHIFSDSCRLLSVEHPESTDPLPFAQIECEAITTLFSKSHVKRISGRGATKLKVETALRESSEIFHFSGHGYHDISSPLKSALLLAGNDNRLTLGEILQIPLDNYYLVCLSACETGITSNTNIIDEFVGLNSGFLAQGVAYVVSTLWTVPDTPSALIMIKFYRALRKRVYDQNGTFEALALSNAQVWLRSLTYRKLIRLYKTVRSKLPIEESSIRPFLLDEIERLTPMHPDDCPYDYPYYWAAFTITGIPPQL